MHDTLQLQKVCEKDEDISPHFLGVFAADQVPWQEIRKRSNWSMIINTDPISKPGQHWVASMKRSDGSGKCLFFDSYGNSPSTYNRQLWKPLERCDRNEKDYQQTLSTVCGDYCVFFLKLFSKEDQPLELNILDRFFDEHDDKSNDDEVHKIVHRWYPKLLNNTQHDEDFSQTGGMLSRGRHYVNQICVARSLS